MEVETKPAAWGPRASFKSRPEVPDYFVGVGPGRVRGGGAGGAGTGGCKGGDGARGVLRADGDVH